MALIGQPFLELSHTRKRNDIKTWLPLLLSALDLPVGKLWRVNEEYVNGRPWLVGYFVPDASVVFIYFYPGSAWGPIMNGVQLYWAVHKHGVIDCPCIAGLTIYISGFQPFQMQMQSSLEISDIVYGPPWVRRRQVKKHCSTVMVIFHGPLRHNVWKPRDLQTTG